jgi:hypothetical protein
MQRYYFKEGREYFTSICENVVDAQIAAEMWNAELITKEEYYGKSKVQQ